MTELTFHRRLRQPCTVSRVPTPVPLPIPGTRELPIEVVEQVVNESDGTRIPVEGKDEESMLIPSREQSTRAPKTMTRPCSGAYLAMPDGVLPYSAYPFMLHERFVLPWDIHIVDHRMLLQSTKCRGVREASSDSCPACSRLLTHRIVEGILLRITNGVHANTSFVYQPIGGLIEILRKKNAMLDGLRFKQLSTSRTLAARARTVGQYERLVMAMGEGKVNRLDALIRAGLNRGLGVRGIIDLLDRARKGLYKPKSFTEEEMSRGLLFLRLGGARVASLAQRTLGAPAPSTLRHGSTATSTITSLSPSATFPTKSEIQRNIRAAFKNFPGNSACGYVLMIDEIKVEERLRWDPSTNRILGLCREHTEHVGLDFCSMSDAKALVQAILCGEIHHASEVSYHLIDIVFLANKCSFLCVYVMIGDCIFNRNPFGG